MLWIIGFILFFAGLMFPSKKQITILLFGFLWVLFAFNTYNADYIAYEGIYQRIGDGYQWTISHYEVGFVALCKICYRLFGLNYQQFVILMASICTVLLIDVVKRYAKYNRQNTILALFMVFQYWVMICQYRYYVGFLLALIGIDIFLNRDDRTGLVRSIFCILSGALFHYSIALFLIVLLVKKLSVKQTFLFLPIAVGLFLLLRLGVFNGIISRIVPGFKLERWLYAEGNRSWAGILLLVVVRLLILGIEHYIYKRESVKVSYDGLYVKRLEQLVKITAICSAFLVFELFNKNYERLFRVPLFLAFVFLTYYKSRNKITLRKVPRSYLMFVGYFGLYMTSFYLSFGGWFVHNLVPLMNNNILLWGSK